MTIDYGDRSDKAKKRYQSNGRSSIVVVSIVFMMLVSFLWILSLHESTENDVINVDDDVNDEASNQRFYHFDKLNQLAADISLHTENPELLVVSYTQQGKKERGATGTPGWGNAVLNFAAVNGMVLDNVTSSLHPFSHTPSYVMDINQQISSSSLRHTPYSLYFTQALSLHRPAYLAHAAISTLFNHPTKNVTWPMMTDERRKQIQNNMIKKRKQSMVERDHVTKKNKGGSVDTKSNTRRLTEQLWTCKMNFKRYHFNTFADALSIGCNMILILHPEARDFLSHLLELQLPSIRPKRQREEAEMIYSHLFQWLFSNPKTWFQQRYQTHKQRILDQCNNQHNRHHHHNITSSSSSSTVIDVVLQVRTFRDLHTNEPLHDQQFWSKEGSKYSSCAMQILQQTFLRRLDRFQRISRSAKVIPGSSNHHHHYHHQQQHHHLCVYITSDYPSVSRMLKESLLSDPSFIHQYHHNNNAKGYRLGLGLEQDRPFSYSVVGHDEIYDAQEDWHSGAALKAGHFNPPIADSTTGNRDIGNDRVSGRNSQSVQSVSSHRQWSEVLDWLVMSEAEVAMMTSDSTFGQTARYRAGYFESRYDHRVTDDLASSANTTTSPTTTTNNNNGIKTSLASTCLPIHDMSQLCALCEQRRQQRQQQTSRTSSTSSSSPVPHHENSDNHFNHHHNHFDCPRRVYQECRKMGKRPSTRANKPYTSMNS